MIMSKFNVITTGRFTNGDLALETYFVNAKAALMAC